MLAPRNYKKFAVLHVNDEERSLKNLQTICGEDFRIISALNADEGLRLLQEHQEKIGVLLADSCMRIHSGIWLLERAREIKPGIARVLLSDGCQWDAVLTALQTGLTRRIIPIPWEAAEIRPTLEAELQGFMLQRERDLLADDLRRMLNNRMESLRTLSADLNIEVTELLHAPRNFLEDLPLRLEASGVNVRDLGEAEYWQDLYGHVMAQFARIDDVMKSIQKAVEEQAPSEVARINLRELLYEGLNPVKAELEVSRVTLEDLLPDDFPEVIAVSEKLQRILELLIKYKMARLSHPGKIQVAARLLETGRFTGDELEVTIADTVPNPLSVARRVGLKGATIEADCRLNRVLSSIIVHQQGGRLHTQREEGKGTTFFIRLPVSRLEA